MILPEIGREGQEKIGRARVLVVGAGGLGCPALQYLAAAGIGTLGIIDGDRVDESNLHRQILFTQADTGCNKAGKAAEKLGAVNPGIRIISYPCFLSPENATEIISRYDLVLDGSDNFPTRYLVNDACVICGKPFISAALFRFEIQLSVFNYQDGPTYRCLFPEPPVNVPDCSEAGILGMVPGVAGTYQAMEAIKLITGTGTLLSGKLRIMNLLDHSTYAVKITPVGANKKISSIQPVNVPTCSGSLTLSYRELTVLLGQEPVQLVDVRSEREFEQDPLGLGESNIPLDELEARIGELAPGKTTVLFCQSGQRSRQAASLLKKHLPGTRVAELEGGISRLSSPFG